MYDAFVDTMVGFGFNVKYAEFLWIIYKFLHSTGQEFDYEWIRKDHEI